VAPAPALSRALDKRHSFGTHAAAFGVNPWRLMTWMGHKRIDETMLYVHLAIAERSREPFSRPVVAKWILTAGSSRCSARVSQVRGNAVATKTKSPPKS
jgi:hypothetical protein